jgi:hypothetical protein
MVATNYNCSQQELYNACRFGWQLCQLNLTTFQKFKPKYTEGYVAEQLAAIEAADVLPDDKARYAAAEAMRVRMLRSKDAVLAQFQILCSYIEDAFSPDIQPMMLKAAGEPFYAKAQAANWSSVTGLLSAAIPFMEEYKADLMAQNNMPEAFIVEFKNLKTQLETHYQQYVALDMAAKTQTATKITANNTIYDALRLMASDGQRFFRNTSTIAHQFVVSNIIAQTRGAKNANITGKVVNKNTATPLSNVTVSIEGTDKITTTDTDGVYHVEKIGAGNYTLRFEIEGFLPIVVENTEVRMGKTCRVNADLEPVAAPQKRLEERLR